MKKKHITQREIGFTQGIAYAANLMCRYDLDAENLIKETGIPIEDFRKYVPKEDLEHLEEIFENLESKSQ